MPFIKLVPKEHACSPPLTRDDMSPLQGGDEWFCDELLENDCSETAEALPCNRAYRWTTLPFTGRWVYIVPEKQDHYKEDT